MNNFGVWLICILVFLACQKDEKLLIKEKIDEKVQDRLETFIRLEKRRCEIKLLEEANKLADSLLRLNPVFITLDSLSKPPLPPKPMMPAFERKKDSIIIAPLIPKPGVESPKEDGSN